jgi:hypothetical protein
MIFPRLDEMQIFDPVLEHVLQFRLSQCGLPHVIYLVENHGSLDSHSVAAERLQTAMVTYAADAQEILASIGRVGHRASGE